MDVPWIGRYSLEKILFLGLSLLLLLSCQITADPSATTSNNDTRSCIVCDSQRDPDCADDTLLPPGNRFEYTCPKNKTWCYKSEGKLTAIGFVHSKLEKIKIRKVDRGCTKPHYKEQCTRVKQSDGYTDFKVCHCKDEFCNRNYTVSEQKVMNPNGAKGRMKNEVWGTVMLYGFFFVVRSFIGQGQGT